MPISRHEALQKIAQASKGAERYELLKNNEIRNAVLSSGANVTIYTGKPHNAKTAKGALSDVYIGLILRKNKKGKLDGLGALGGLAERTDIETFNQLTDIERVKLIQQKDDVILDGAHPVLTQDIDIIRKNNVLREMREELDDLGIRDITINPANLELITMPKVKDDNYMINIWNGIGECFAITPFCHIYEDKSNLIDEISSRAAEKNGGEAVTYRKIPLFEALSSYGTPAQGGDALEDGRSAMYDYRYPHEHLAAWSLAAKLLKYKPERMVALAQEVQLSAKHPISFERLAVATGQSMADLAQVLHLKEDTLLQMERATAQVRASKSPLQHSDYSL